MCCVYVHPPGCKLVRNEAYLSAHVLCLLFPQIASMVTVLGETKPRVKNILTLGSCAAIVGAEVSCTSCKHCSRIQGIQGHD